MAKAPVLHQRLAVDESWYDSPATVDMSAVEAEMDWKALLGRKVEKVGFSKFAAALSKGVPPALRPQVWLSFSGAGERLRAQPTLYAQALIHI